jgi:hemolysin D
MPRYGASREAKVPDELKPRGARIWRGIANAFSFVGRSRAAAMLDGARVRSLQFLRGKGNFRYLSGHTEESEFLPAALEIVDTPPPPASRVIATVIILFFMIALLWASFGSVDIISTAPGRIVSTGRTKTIQPLDSGVVHEIHVQDGQRVKAGQVLIEIDTTISASERDRLAIDYMQATLDAARLRAASNLDGDPLANFVAPEGASDAQIALQKERLVNQIDEIRAQLSGLDHQIAQNTGNRDAVTATITKLIDSIPYLKKRAEVRGGLAEKGYGSKLDYLTTQQDLVEHQQELKVQKGRLAEAESAISALQQERLRAEGEYKRTTFNDLADDEQKVATLRAQLAQASERYRLQTLTAPVDGTVQQLAVHTVGGVVTPAQFLMSIVPADSKVEIEAMVSNRDIGFVHSGQYAEVKIDTFNFTRYGLIPGRVQSVSQDSILRDRPTDRSNGGRRVGDDTDTGEPPGQELVYSARVSLAQTKIQVDDRLVDLTPGMAVTVEIKTGSRHVIAYLLSPFQRHAHGALRER